MVGVVDGIEDVIVHTVRLFNVVRLINCNTVVVGIVRMVVVIVGTVALVVVGTVVVVMGGVVRVVV